MARTATRMLLLAFAFVAILACNHHPVRADEPANDNLDLSEPRRSLATRNCMTVTVPPCIYRRNRDILFALDTSNSMNRKLFYSMQLDFVESIMCAFNPGDVTRAGLITFSNVVTVRIPLAKYTMPQWFTKIEALRKDTKVCCAQGTPTAEMFDKAFAVFTAKPSSAERTTFVLSDGAPFQVTNAKTFPGAYPYPKFSMADYMLNIVPSSAIKLKTISRLTVVGLPSSNGQLPRALYFTGLPDPDLHVCGEDTPENMQGYRYNENFPLECGLMDPDLFPIVSKPVGENWRTMSFNTNLQSLLGSMLPALCTSPTSAPVPIAGETGTSAPVPEPAASLRPTSSAPVSGPAASLNPTSSAPSSKEPTLAPSQLPTKEPTPAPSRLPTKEPTYKPTRFPTRVPTKKPTVDDILDILDIDVGDIVDADVGRR